MTTENASPATGSVRFAVMLAPINDDGSVKWREGEIVGGAVEIANLGSKDEVGARLHWLADALTLFIVETPPANFIARAKRPSGAR